MHICCPRVWFNYLKIAVNLTFRITNYVSVALASIRSLLASGRERHYELRIRFSILMARVFAAAFQNLALC